MSPSPPSAGRYDCSSRSSGVELLHRTTHEFELTEAGQSLFERGPALLAAAEELWRSVRSYGTGERGEVVFAYGASSSYWGSLLAG